MSTGRKLAKRSIVGTRVCALAEDGKYYSGSISAVNNPKDSQGLEQGAGGLNITSSTRYVVRFDPALGAPHPSTEFSDRQLVGPGFGSITSARLVPGQKVYLTYKGREIQAEVVKHDPNTDDVHMIPSGPQEGGIASTITRKIEEVRLLKSRKSARLVNSDTDFARLADMGSDRKRLSSTSTSIDVPAPPVVASQSRKRRPSSSNDSERSFNQDNHHGHGPGQQQQQQQQQQHQQQHQHHHPREEFMDECSAAMVLMSLSTSPKNNPLPAHCQVQFCGSWDGDRAAGMAGMGGGGVPSNSSVSSGASWRSRSSTPSPPLSEESGNGSWPSSLALSSGGSSAVHHHHHQHHQLQRKGSWSELAQQQQQQQQQRSNNYAYLDQHNYHQQQQPQPHQQHHHPHSQQQQACSVSSGSPTTDEGWQSDLDCAVQPPRKAKRIGVVHQNHRSRVEPYDYCNRRNNNNNNNSSSNNNNVEDPAIKIEDFYENENHKPGVVWKCVWRPDNSRQVCGQRGATWQIVATHVLKEHLQDQSSNTNITKDAIDFYMDEEDPADHTNVVNGFSPPTKSHFDMARPRAEDPEYHLLVQSNNVQPSNQNNLMIANVISMAPQAIKQLKPSPTKPLQAYNSPAGPLINMSVINKAPHSPRRVRGETKKCRKVYGMEHRDLWCTQCKWKKACTRFNDNN